MNRPSPELVGCPHCGARNFAIDDSCAACGRSLTVVIGPRPKVRRVNLSTIMILIVVVAVCLAPVRSTPGLSIVLLVILVPPSVRGILMVEERKADGRPMVLQQKIDAFASSCMITTLILLTASVAFFATCLPCGMMIVTPRRVGISPYGELVAFASGGVAALSVIYFLGRRFWPRKD